MERSGVSVEGLEVAFKVECLGEAVVVSLVSRADVHPSALVSGVFSSRLSDCPLLLDSFFILFFFDPDHKSC